MTARQPGRASRLFNLASCVRGQPSPGVSRLSGPTPEAWGRYRPHACLLPDTRDYGYRYAQTASMNVSPLCMASHFSLNPNLLWSMPGRTE